MERRHVVFLVHQYLEENGYTLAALALKNQVEEIIEDVSKGFFPPSGSLISMSPKSMHMSHSKRFSMTTPRRGSRKPQQCSSSQKIFSAGAMAITADSASRH